MSECHSLTNFIGEAAGSGGLMKNRVGRKMLTPVWGLRT
jgi:hypothetical protein